MRDRLIERMRAVAEGWRVPAVALWLFGSAARGDGTADSDIDVLVVRSDRVDVDDDTWQEQLDRMASEVTAWTGNDCRMLEYSRSQFADLAASGEQLVSELRADAVRIAGEPIERLAPRLQSS